jgi:peptide/nickel transport system permease protein
LWAKRVTAGLLPAALIDQGKDQLRALKGFVRFIVTRGLTLAAALVTAVYLTILITNLGGYVDSIIAARIEMQVGMMMAGGWLMDLPVEERMDRADEVIAAMQDEAGLNDPLPIRTARWLGDGLTLNWGEPERRQDYGLIASGLTVRDVIVDRLSRTLLIFGVANILMFGAALLFALALNRRYGGLLDRLFVLLTPLSSAPAWVYGILLSIFMLRFFHFSPSGQLPLDSWYTKNNLTSILITLRQMLLPFIAIFLAGFFQTAYTWRNYFQVYSNEEYVNMAYAKGLPKKRVDRQHILRPALPALLTSFALLLAVLWQEVIALEYFFDVEGIGHLFTVALNAYDTPMIVAITTTFAYLLVITFFVLDICYVLVDPRVRIGSEKQDVNVIESSRKPFWQRIGSSSVTTGSKSRRGFSMPQFELSGIASSTQEFWLEIKRVAREMRHYPAALVGLAIIALLSALSIYAVIALPYQEAITLWRTDKGTWDRVPREAPPTWLNYFVRRDFPETISFSSASGDGNKEISLIGDEITDETYTFTFDYDYGDFPQDIIVDIKADYEERGPHVTLTWVWADGTEKELTSYKPRPVDAYFVSRDNHLQHRLDSEVPLQALFLGSDGQAEEPVPGTYTMRVNALHFEPGSDLDVDVTIMGQVYGLAGTDAKSRDLMIALLWGTPIALAFGLIAALVISVGGMTIAAAGAWYGGWVDRVVQFLTEVNLILPFLPIALMIFTLYSRSILTILGVTIALSLFGSAVKTFRAAFLQLRGAPYIEAARAYGASNLRIVGRYLMPRLLTMLVPMLIVLVPTFVFLEATLAFLGMSDPQLPTWGKLVVAALSYGMRADAAHLIIAPFGLLFLTGFAFAMVGLSLERILEPRLREA